MVVEITAKGSNCAPPAVSEEGRWITYSTATLSKTKGAFTVSVPDNPSSSSRTGKVIVGGKNFPITQTGTPCTLTLGPTSNAFDYNGGEGSFVATATPADCKWTVSKTAPWITITSSKTGTGAATVSYSVAKNWALPHVTRISG